MVVVLWWRIVCDGEKEKVTHHKELYLFWLKKKKNERKKFAWVPGAPGTRTVVYSTHSRFPGYPQVVNIYM